MEKMNGVKKRSTVPESRVLIIMTGIQLLAEEQYKCSRSMLSRWHDMHEEIRRWFCPGKAALGSLPSSIHICVGIAG